MQGRRKQGGDQVAVSRKAREQASAGEKGSVRRLTPTTAHTGELGIGTISVPGFNRHYIRKSLPFFRLLLLLLPIRS